MATTKAKRKKAVAKAAAPFNYAQTLKNEGIFASDAANIAAANAAARAQRDAAVKALQFQWNDPANPFAFTTEAERSRKEAVANMAADRAARGVSASGGTTLAQMNIGHDYSKGLYDQLNSVTGQIGSLDANLAETLRSNQDKLGGYIGDAQQRLIDAGIAPVGGVAPGSSPADLARAAAMGRAPGLRGGTFDFGAGASAFQPNQSAVFAKPFDYSKIKAGYFAANGRPVASQQAAIRMNDLLARKRLTGRTY